MKSVILTGGRAPVAAELARHFYSAGYRVLAAESGPNLLAASRFVTASYRVPAPRWEPAKFASAVEGMAAHFQADLVLPSCEEVFWLAEAVNQGSFPRLGECLFAPPIEVLKQLHHKARFIELVDNLGFGTPKTIQINSQAQLGQLQGEKLASGQASPKIVFKPIYSRFGSRTVIASPNEGPPKLPTITARHPWLAQEFLTGEELCLSGVFDNGEPRALSVYLPRWRTGGNGAGTYFQPVPIEGRRYREATQLANSLAGELNYTGFLSLDFIDTPAGLLAIECNPRPTSGLHLLDGNLAEALRSHGPLLSAGNQPKRLSLAAANRLFRSPSEWLGSRSALRGAVPISQQLRVAGSLLSSAIEHRISPLEASTYDLEYDGEALTLAKEETAEQANSWGERAFGTLRDPSTGLTRGITNASAKLQSVRVDGHFMPLTLPDQPDREFARSIQRSKQQTYLVSPFGHYIGFAQDELGELHSPRLEALLRPFISVLGRVLKWGEIDQVMLVNNALISTNLHPNISSAGLGQMTHQLRIEHPQLAIGWRNVHGRDSDFPEKLRNAGYRLIPARSILFVPTADRGFARRRDYRRDLRLLEVSGYQIRELTAPSLAERSRLIELYRMLYIEKYSQFSPQYTEEFISHSSQHGMLRYLVLERDGQIDGMIGYFISEGYLAAPLLGYDLNKPQNLGLYRMLNVLITETALRHSVTVHASSGVPAFKRSRGAELEIEYFAVYYQHLSRRQRLAWQLLDVIINSIAEPLIAKFGL